MLEHQLLIHLAVTISTIAGAIVAIQKVIKNSRVERNASVEEKEKESEKILTQAREEMQLIKLQFEAEVKALKVDLKSLESGTLKDIQYIKESQESEIKNLGEKIQDLRDQLNSHHTQILSLLEKLIN